MPKAARKKASAKRTPRKAAAVSLAGPTAEQIERVCSLMIGGKHPSEIMVVIADAYLDADANQLLTAAFEQFIKLAERPRHDIFAWAIACAHGLFTEARNSANLTEARLCLKLIAELSDAKPSNDSERNPPKPAGVSTGIRPLTDDQISALVGEA